MATIKEVKLSKDGEMVTPVVLADSIIKLDGTKLIETINSIIYSIGGFLMWHIICQSAITKSIRSICYGNDKLIAGGDYYVTGDSTYATIAYSTNGINWTAVSQTVLHGNLSSICFGNGKFVATSGGKYIAYSTDGIEWVAGNNLPDKTLSSPTMLCYGNGIFVAITYEMSIDSASSPLPAPRYRGYIFTSTDGVSWTQRKATDLESDIPYMSICYGDDKFIVGGGTGTIEYSTNGINWTEVSSSLIRINSICYGDGKFIMGGLYGSMAYSTDGTNWTDINQSILTSNVYSICYGDGKFIASDGTSVAYSTDGINWTDIVNPIANTISTIYYNKGRFIVGSASGAMAIGISKYSPF